MHSESLITLTGFLPQEKIDCRGQEHSTSGIERGGFVKIVNDKEIIGTMKDTEIVTKNKFIYSEEYSQDEHTIEVIFNQYSGIERLACACTHSQLRTAHNYTLFRAHTHNTQTRTFRTNLNGLE